MLNLIWIQLAVNVDNDKNTYCLREIAGNVKVPDLTEKDKLRKHVEQTDDGSEEDEEVGDFKTIQRWNFKRAAILPSKRARKIPEKIQVSQEDLAELHNQTEDQTSAETKSEDIENESSDSVSIEDLKEQEQNISETEE